MPLFLALRAAVRAKVEAATQAYLAIPPEPPTAMFDHLFATLPKALVKQRDSLKGGGRG